MPDPTLQATVHVHPDVVWRELDGEIVLLNVVTGLYYGLDDVGASVWRLLGSTPVALETIRDRLVAEYDGDAATIERDLRQLVARLAHTQLLVVS